MSTNLPRVAFRTRLIIAFIAAVFGVSVLLHQMYSATPAQAISSTIVISQVYGAGGNVGASHRNDFIELFNKGTTPINLTGWSVQYASSAGAGNFASNVTILTGTLAPGQYYLVHESSGGANGVLLPAADATGGIAMAATAGKVIVANTTTGLACNGGSTACSAAQLAQIVDLVGYGSGTNFFEGAGPTPATSATNAVFRDDAGCTDLDNNNIDFASAVAPVSPGTPAPRNTASPVSPCVGPPALSINDVTVAEGDSGTTTATFTVSLSSPAPIGGVTFDIATADGTGLSPATVVDNDYVNKSLTGQSIPFNSQTYTFDVTVNGDMNFESNETFFVNVTNPSGAVIGDGQGIGTITNDDCPPAAADIVISQVYGGGGNSGAIFTHDYIELFNQGNTPVNLSGWSVQYASAAGTSWAVTPLSGSIAPGGYYLIQEASNAAVGSPLPTPDTTGTINMSGTSGKVALSSSTVAFSGSCPTCAIDLVGYGGANCFEGAGSTASPSNSTAALRKRGGCFDSDNNNIDFSIGSPNPRNTSSPTNDCSPISAAIHDIQGSGAATPFAGQLVSTTGIVTALKTNGFFLQDTAVNYDANPATSEGIFVFTSSAPAAAVGNAVLVVGSATEFFNLTQIESTLPGDVTVSSTGNPLPSPIVLTTTILDPAGTPDQLERFEAMRMHADTLVSVAPSNEFGEIFTVLDGVARPFREPGIEVSFTVPPDPTSGVVDCCIPRWDENPERIMIDSDGLAGSTVFSVTSNVTISNVTGPLDFSFGDYKVLPETTPSRSANMSAVPVPTPVAGELTVAGFNIENFNNNATQRHKAALAIRDVLHLPDILGHVEIFELTGLQALADEIEAISGVHYEPYLIEADGNSGDADQDVAFLVKTSRVQVDSVTQEELAGCDGTEANCNTYTAPDGTQDLLNDRPPLVLRGTVDAGGLNPRPIIVVVNHTRSFIDVELLTGAGPRVRAKRKAQAEFLADLLQDLQTANPTTAILSIGDYNAYQFSDGYGDPISVIKGSPTPDDEIVVDESPDLVNPNFINLSDTLPADQRYSFIFEGTPQLLDHMLVNTVANSYVQRYAIARNNIDFPEVPNALFAGDATRPERNSDHDMPVVYLQFPPPSADLSITKTASSGTVVTNTNVTYTIVVTNNGISPAQSVLVTDNLPSATTFVSCASDGGGVCGGSGNNRTVSFTSLGVGDSATITIVATLNCNVPNNTVVSNTASVSSATGDPDNNNNSQTADITASNPPPIITGASVDKPELWPPNHKMVEVTVNYGTSDNCGSAICTLSVTSNEPVNGGGDGNTSPDWEIIDNHHVNLRAERSGNGNGRVYTITITCTDSGGGTSTQTVTVTVPKSKN